MGHPLSGLELTLDLWAEQEPDRDRRVGVHDWLVYLVDDPLNVPGALDVPWAEPMFSALCEEHRVAFSWFVSLGQVVVVRLRDFRTKREWAVPGF